MHSNDGLWSTVDKTHNTSVGEVRRLFNAGDECFGTFRKPGGRQSIAKYSVKENEWKHVTDIPSTDQLGYYGITADRDRVYLVGGFDGGGNVRDTILVYDINTGKECCRKKMSSRRVTCLCTVLDNMLYVGGKDGEKHSLNTVECISLRNDCIDDRVTVAPTPTYNYSLTSLCGQLVVLGGKVGESPSSPVSNMISVLSPSLDTWLPLPRMNQQRIGHGTCTVGDDTLVVVGGKAGDSEYLSSVEVLKL